MDGDSIEKCQEANSSRVDEETYDSEFEQELQALKGKLARESSLKRVYCPRTRDSDHRASSKGSSKRCKLVPNVSFEWIHELRLQT